MPGGSPLGPHQSTRRSPINIHALIKHLGLLAIFLLLLFLLLLFLRELPRLRLAGLPLGNGLFLRLFLLGLLLALLLLLDRKSVV